MPKETQFLYHVSIYRGFDVFRDTEGRFIVSRHNRQFGWKYKTAENALDAIDINRVEWLKQEGHS